MVVSKWVTQGEAAALLGVHKSLLGKLVARGDLMPRVGRRPSLPRADVVALGATRAAAEFERERRRATLAESKLGPRPPDEEHVWLLSTAAAAVLRCSEIALHGRATRGRVPYVVSGRRRWFRLDHVELVVRAEVARTRRQVSG